MVAILLDRKTGWVPEETTTLTVGTSPVSTPSRGLVTAADGDRILNSTRIIECAFTLVESCGPESLTMRAHRDLPPMIRPGDIARWSDIRPRSVVAAGRGTVHGEPSSAARSRDS